MHGIQTWERFFYASPFTHNDYRNNYHFLFGKVEQAIRNTTCYDFFYFMISTYIAPIYSRSTKEGDFHLWIPLGFIFVFFYLFRSERNHPSKMKASILGLLHSIISVNSSICQIVFGITLTDALLQEGVKHFCILE